MLKLLLPLLLISLAHAEEETVKKAEAAPVNDVVWPTKLPAQVYVIPVKVDPAAVAAAKKESDGGLPKGPFRKMMEGDEDDKKEKLKDLQTDITKSLIDKMKEIGLPARAWTSPGAPPADGWKVDTEIVDLDPNKKLMKENPEVGIILSIADPSSSGGKPFLTLDSSAKAKLSPGPGMSPMAKGMNLIMESSGLQDSMQVDRLTGQAVDEIAKELKDKKLLKDD
jgi:hypothetical protein